VRLNADDFAAPCFSHPQMKNIQIIREKMLQCAAVGLNMLQSMLQCVPVCLKLLQCAAVCLNMLQSKLRRVCCSMLQCVVVCCSMFQCV